MLLPLAPIQLIMIAYHRPNDLIRCVLSILQYTPEPFLLTIIDNSSGKIDDILESFKDQRIRIIHNQCNLGKGKSTMIWYNQIMANNDEKYFISIDSDIAVESNWLSKLRRTAAKIPNFGILAPVIKDEPPNSFAKQLQTKLVMHQKDEKSHFIDKTIYQNRQTAGPLFLINRGFFEGVGGYAQNQLYGNDDGLLCSAACAHGLFVGIATDVEVLHLENDVDDGYRAWKARNVHKNTDNRGYWD